MSLSDGPQSKVSTHTEAQSPTTWYANILMSSKVTHGEHVQLPTEYAKKIIAYILVFINQRTSSLRRETLNIETNKKTRQVYPSLL